jgi:hypothetical protein
MVAREQINHQVLAEYCEAFARSFRGNAILVKLVSRLTHYDLLIAILITEAEWRLGTRASPMTIGELKRSSNLSPRSIQVITTALRFYDLLETRVNPDDRRSQILLGTPKLDRIFLEWLQPGLLFLDHCLPPHQIKAFNILEDPDLLMSFKANAGRAYLEGALDWSRYEEMAYFGQHHAGFQLLASLLACHYQGQTYTTSAGFHSLFGVSQSHIRNILTGAAAKELVNFSVRDQAVRCTPKLINGFEQYILDELAFFESHVDIILG